MIPVVSPMTTCFAAARSSSFATPVPAAPAPEMTIFTSRIRLPTSLSAFSSAASTTTAVPY